MDHEHFVVLAVLTHDIPGSSRETEAAPLTNRVEPKSTVAAELRAVREVANDPRILAEVVFDKRVVRYPPEETDSLGVGSVAVGEMQSAGLGSDLGLGQPTDGEEAPCDLLLGHLAEKVRLVLDRVDPPEEAGQGSGMVHPRMVSAGDEVDVAVDAVDEGAELDQTVAQHVRTRSATSLEFDHGGGNYRVVVVALQRNDLEGNLESSTDFPNELQILLPGAAAEKGELVLEPDLQVIGFEFVRTLFSESCQSDR
jgi:hypothetical protein